MIWFLSNWKTVLGGIGIVSIAWMLHSLDVNRIEANHREELSAQAKAQFEQCRAEKAITEEVSNDYQKKLASLTASYNSLRKLYNGRCVAVSNTESTVGHNAASAGSQLSGSHGIYAGYLIDFAYDAEQVRLRLIGCQDFVRRVQGLYSDQ